MVQQIEDALIDAVQGDNEMGTYMGTYLDARKRLSEKVKNRGFWPSRGKGFGKKGKTKFPMRQCKPLAVRIAESDCRLCGQRGHWKAECPKRNHGGASSTSMPKTQMANVLVSVDKELDDDEVDVYVMASQTWPDDVLMSNLPKDQLTGFRKSSPPGAIGVCEGVSR